MASGALVVAAMIRDSRDFLLNGILLFSLYAVKQRWLQ
jgi:hypothetical protein